METVKASSSASPRLTELLKKMQEVSRVPPQPYYVVKKGSHVVVERRKPEMDATQL